MEYQDIKTKLTELRKSNSDILAKIRSLREELFNSINEELNENGKKYIGKYYVKRYSPSDGGVTYDIIKITKFNITPNQLLMMVCDNWWYSIDLETHTIDGFEFKKDLNCFEEVINFSESSETSDIIDIDNIVTRLTDQYTEITEDDFKKQHLSRIIDYVKNSIGIQ